MEPSGSEASEARSKDKGNAPVIDLDSENVNQHVDEHIDERVTDDVDEQKKKRRLHRNWLRSTPADLQDMPINGLPVEEMVENLKKLELDMFSNEKKQHNNSSQHQV
ncbi:hypothetical protein Tco_0618410 [Tanacetum coccineum]